MSAGRRIPRGPLASLCVLIVGALGCACLAVGWAAANGTPPEPWANWGSDHVGQSVPEYVTGDECLFCHRDDFGNQWSRNRHERTIRPADPQSAEMRALAGDLQTKQVASEVESVLGDRRQIRYLKKRGDYGKLALLSAKFAPRPLGRKKGRRLPGTLTATKEPHWENATFGQSCAGCHTTAVDPKTQAFAAISLDCYSCHGIVDLRHSKDTKLIFFGKGRNDPPRVAVAICAQCHLRNGRSRSTGLPYPDNFVAGDNLFRDFAVGLKQADLAEMNPGDRHIALNVREVLEGNSNTTCVSCHDVHRQSAAKHRQVADGATCVSCHEPGKPKSKHLTYEVHSSLCGY
jgi:hypothetical protein